MSDKPFYVRVTSCSAKNFWYKEFIGEVFLVKASRNTSFQLVGGPLWIQVQDCERVTIKVKEENANRPEAAAETA